jgi:hypothetical protein
MKRMAPEESLATQPDAFEHPIFFDRFISIGRAGRNEPAVVAEQGRNKELIAPDQG